MSSFSITPSVSPRTSATVFLLCSSGAPLRRIASWVEDVLLWLPGDWRTRSRAGCAGRVTSKVVLTELAVDAIWQHDKALWHGNLVMWHVQFY